MFARWNIPSSLRCKPIGGRYSWLWIQSNWSKKKNCVLYSWRFPKNWYKRHLRNFLLRFGNLKRRRRLTPPKVESDNTETFSTTCCCYNIWILNSVWQMDMDSSHLPFHHFHIDHNAPCLPPPTPTPLPNLFEFSWDGCNTHEKLETMVMQNVGLWTRCTVVNLKMVNTLKCYGRKRIWVMSS